MLHAVPKTRLSEHTASFRPRVNVFADFYHANQFIMCAVFVWYTELLQEGKGDISNTRHPTRPTMALTTGTGAGRHSPREQVRETLTPQG